MSAANEIAVEAFLARRIGFLDIAAVVERVMDEMGPNPAESLHAVFALDIAARAIATRRCAECRVWAA